MNGYERELPLVLHRVLHRVLADAPAAPPSTSPIILHAPADEDDAEQGITSMVGHQDPISESGVP